jgi:hypothetical protein
LAWNPPQRPGWLARLNAHGLAVGGPENLVSLNPAELIQTAMASTGGLDDFGATDLSDWQTWFEVLARSLDTESQLHAVGRLLARHDLLRCLRNRLQLAALWKTRPAVLETELLPPSFVVGTARSGTSILSELLALDPDARTPALWEMLHPVESLQDEALRAPGHSETALMEDLTPEYATMHENSGDLPNECLYMMMNTFISDIWGGSHFTPSYDKAMLRADHRPVYAYHKKILQTLQHRGAERCSRWGLKAPSHLALLEELFSVYPNAWVIRIHRDPLKSLPSTISLMGTLKRMRCADVDVTRNAERQSEGTAYMFEQEIAKRSDGRVPNDRFIDVHYHELMRDPLATVQSIYDRTGWRLQDEVAGKIEAYVRDRPRGTHGTHQYSLASMGFDHDRERERFRFYCEHFDVPEET